MDPETLLANWEDRTVKGLLLPYGELSRTSNVGPVSFARGTLALPADPDVVGANRHHVREDPVGRAVALEDTDAGVVATFRIARTPEGDATLQAIHDKTLTKLSAEVRGLVRDAKDKTRALAGALFGAAFVTEGAFESAALYAELAESTDVHMEDEYTDEAGITWRRVTDTSREVTTDTAPDGTVTTTATSTTTETVTEAPATGDTTNQGGTVDPEETLAAGAATVPATVPQTMLAGATPNQQTEPVSNTIYQVAHALAAYFGKGDTSLMEALAATSRNAGDLMFAALTDVKVSGAGAAIIQPQWIGDVWAERSHVRKFAPLLAQAALTSFKVKGFKFTTKATGGDWAGDKTAVPSGSMATAEVSVDAARWAMGHDIAREFRDFDVPEFWVAYFQQGANSYSRWADTKALADVLAGATAVTAGAVPSGANPATVLLVDGALSVIATEEATPSWAVAGADVYRTLLLQERDDVIATLSLSLGLESGDLAGFRIIPSTSASLTGKVLVGAREAATFYELPGAPIRTEALDMVKGGIDTGMFGYAATVINNPAALALVAPAA